MIPVVLSPSTAYATKRNIGFPGTQAAATAAESATKTRMEDNLPSTVTVTVAAGAVTMAR